MRAKAHGGGGQRWILPPAPRRRVGRIDTRSPLRQEPSQRCADRLQKRKPNLGTGRGFKRGGPKEKFKTPAGVCQTQLNGWRVIDGG